MGGILAGGAGGEIGESPAACVRGEKREREAEEGKEEEGEEEGREEGDGMVGMGEMVTPGLDAVDVIIGEFMSMGCFTTIAFTSFAERRREPAGPAHK